MRSLQRLAILGVATLILLLNFGCLPDSKIVEISSKAPEFFEGATAAASKGDSNLVTWTKTTTVPVSEFRVYMVKTDNSLKLLQKTTPTADKYIHSGLTPGHLYRYVVKAVDMSGTEDANMKIVGNVNYPGITSATIEAGDLTVDLPTIEGDIQEIRIYVQASGTTKQLIKTTQPSTTSISISGLRSGVAYTISAQAYNSLVGEDGNTVTKKMQAPSITFAGNSPRFLGFQNAMAFGQVPGWQPFDPDHTRDLFNPSTPGSMAYAVIQWVPFRFATATTKYRLLRTDAGATIDFAISLPCSTVSVGTCLVCEGIPATIGNSCPDKTIQSGKTYDYVITQILKDADNKEYAEEIPLEYNPMNDEKKSAVGDYTPYRLQVSTPPDNMVLVPRDGVNYEYCSLLGRAPRTDRNMSCRFSGPGDRPSRAGQIKVNNQPVASETDQLKLEEGYFDFGYNMMVDRFGQACNWSRKCDVDDPTNPNCGLCGPPSGGQPTPGDCFGISSLQSGAPSNNTGRIGNVFFPFGTFSNSKCFVKVPTNAAGTTSRWEAVNDMTLGDRYTLSGAIDAFQTSFGEPYRSSYLPVSNSPRDNYAVPIMQIQSATGNLLCNKQNSVYGQHRLLRLMEARAAMAPPTREGDLSYRSPGQVRDIEIGPNSANPYADLSDNPIRGCNGWAGNISYYNSRFQNAGTDAPLMRTITTPVPIGAPSFASWPTLAAANQVWAFSPSTYFKDNFISTKRDDNTELADGPAALPFKFLGLFPIPYERILIKLPTTFPATGNYVGSNYGFFLGSWATSQCVSRYGMADYLSFPWITSDTIPASGDVKAIDTIVPNCALVAAGDTVSLAACKDPLAGDATRYCETWNPTHTTCTTSKPFTYEEQRYTKNLWSSAGRATGVVTRANDANITKGEIFNNMINNYNWFELTETDSSTLDSSNNALAGLSFGASRTIFLPSSNSSHLYGTTSYSSSFLTSTNDLTKITGISSKDGAIGSILLNPVDPINVDGLTPSGLPINKGRSRMDIEYIPASQISDQVSSNDIWAVFPVGNTSGQRHVAFAVGVGRRWSTAWMGDLGDPRNLSYRCGVAVRPKN
jgi:hypothetical protein